MFGLFGKRVKKHEFEQLNSAVQTGFDKVKQDVSGLSDWIKHLHDKGSAHEDELSDIYEELSTIKSELQDLRNVLEILGKGRLFKQRQTLFNKQTAVQVVQTPVQTAVQSRFLGNFLDILSVTERAIIWILLNSDLKLSYDDLAAMLGKERATVRGQINSIKQKNEGLIAEQIESNNKKRFYIPEHIKETLLKKAKVKVRRGRKSKMKEKG